MRQGQSLRMKQNLVVLGAQWGDEGKGKLVDYLAGEADYVVRFQGGHNAGHTICFDGKTFKLNIVPSGILRPHVTAVIAGGTVVACDHLLEEIKGLEDAGIDLSGRLWVSDTAPLVLPLHAELDALREGASGTDALGTTKLGIGPAYEDKVGRRALRFGDLIEGRVLREKLARIALHHNPLRRALGAPPVDLEALNENLQTWRALLKDYAVRVPERLYAAARKGKRILFEGGQGAMLDIDHGTFPYVTSSNTVGASAAVSCGLPFADTGKILAIVKAYTTRVGAGPFPTELSDGVGRHLAQKGLEIGTTTGRARRCGWLDVALLKRSVQFAGADSMAITKLDVLDGLEALKIATAYTIDGRRYESLPAWVDEATDVQPVYETMAGWSGSCANLRRWDDLPEQARAYLKRIEALCGVPLALVSTGPDRAATFATRPDVFVG